MINNKKTTLLHSRSFREAELKFENNLLTNSSAIRKINEKLENRIKILESDLDQEVRKCREASKLYRQMERSFKDMEYQYLQEKRNSDRMEVKTFGQILCINIFKIMFRTSYLDYKIKTKCIKRLQKMQKKWQL